MIFCSFEGELVRDGKLHVGFERLGLELEDVRSDVPDAGRGLAERPLRGGEEPRERRDAVAQSQSDNERTADDREIHESQYPRSVELQSHAIAGVSRRLSSDLSRCETQQPDERLAAEEPDQSAGSARTQSQR